MAGRTVSPPPPMPTSPNGGAWTQPNGPGSPFVWSPGATPDPGLVSQWGYTAITDNRQDPTGVMNHGTWVPTGRGGWNWAWGATPSPDLVSKYGASALTDPNKDPNGSTRDAPGGTTLPPPLVTPPSVADAWGGQMPDVTGQVNNDGDNQTVSQPPTHPAFAVSPGQIRYAGQVILEKADVGIQTYDQLQAAVAAAPTDNALPNQYDDPSDREMLLNTMNSLTLSAADALRAAGQFAGLYSDTANMYAHADQQSFVPPE